MEQKLKIILIGPCKTGKSALANFLSSNVENSFPEYHPTRGVRILEFEKKNINGTGNIEIELWDCSGNHEFSICWPAIQYRAHGVIFMYDGEIDHHKSELLFFYQVFVSQLNLSPAQCLIIAKNKAAQLPNILANVTQISGDIDRNGDQLKNEFFKFIDQIISIAGTSDD